MIDDGIFDVEFPDCGADQRGDRDACAPGDEGEAEPVELLPSTGTTMPAAKRGPTRHKNPRQR